MRTYKVGDRFVYPGISANLCTVVGINTEWGVVTYKTFLGRYGSFQIGSNTDHSIVLLPSFEEELNKL